MDTIRQVSCEIFMRSILDSFINIQQQVAEVETVELDSTTSTTEQVLGCLEACPRVD
jgi:hypothetical protein